MKYYPLITVITVVYNGASTLENTILSVVNQSYENIEYIIIDGGSTDDTIDIIKKYSNRINYWLSEQDNGIYDAMNKGVTMASGEWIYFLGADDILNNCIEEIIPLFEAGKIIYGNVFFKTKLEIYSGKFNSIKIIRKNLPHQAIFYPSCVFNKFSYETKYRYMADYYLNLLCWKDKSLIFKYIPVTIAVYNDEGLSSVYADRQFRNNQFKIFMKCMPWYLLPYVFLRKTPSLLIKFLRKNE